MSKTSRIFFILFLLICSVAAWLGYKALKGTKKPSSQVLGMLPGKCDLLLCFEDYPGFSNELRNKNLLWQDIQRIRGPHALERHFALLDSVMEVNELLRETLEDNPSYLGIYSGEFIFTFNVKEINDERSIREYLESQNDWFGKQRLFHMSGDGVIVISNSMELAGSIFTTDMNKLVNDTVFMRLKSSLKYRKCGMYVSSAVKGVLAGSFSDVVLAPERAVFNGVRIATDGGSRSNSVETALIGKLPLLINSFELFGLGLSVNRSEDAQTWWHQVNDSAMFRADVQFRNSLSGTGIRVRMPSGRSSLVLGVQDTAALAEIIPFMTDSSEKETGFMRLRNGGKEFHSSTFTGEGPECTWLLMTADALILSAEKEDLSVFSNALINGSSLNQNKGFAAYASGNFGQDIHYLSYAMLNSADRRDLPFGHYLSDSDAVHLKNAGHFSFAYTRKGSLETFRMNVSGSQESTSDEPNVLWTLRGEEGTGERIHLFRNHLNGGNELVSVNGKQITLISVTGKVLWKKEMPEEIMSEIHTVDAFNNGKYQMLFNTKNRLCLVDRNGKDVQGFPVKLPASATGKLTVLDYGSKNDLRLFIPCSDRKIYNFSIWGEKQEGFKPLQTENEVRLPVRFCRVGASDYLITADVKGKIYAFSRKGEGRIDFRNRIVDDAEDLELMTGDKLSTTHLVYYDKTGHLINRVSLTDKKDVSNTSSDKTVKRIFFFDVDDNKIKDLLIAYGNSVMVYGMNGEALQGLDTEEETELTDVSACRTGGVTYITGFSAETNVACIKNTETGIVKSFKASSIPFLADLFNDGKVYALLKSRNELKCIRL